MNAMQVKAAVHYQPGEGVEIEMLDLEQPREHEVRVRYVASGVCHSDLHHIQGLVPHPTPVVFGHEGAGIVEAVGPDVSGVQVGDHVVTSYIPSCGRCYYCTIGRPNLCELRDRPRYLLLDGTSRFRKGNQDVFQYLQLGTYAEMATVPDVSVIPIRKDAPLEVVCLVSCGVMTGAGSVINRAQVKPGSTVAVFGCGGIGLNAIQAAALVGAAKIVAVDVFDQKLEWAKEFGATHTVNARQVDDPVAAVKQICGRDGADYAIEAVGIQQTIGAGISLDSSRWNGSDDRRPTRGYAPVDRSDTPAPGADPDRHELRQHTPAPRPTHARGHVHGRAIQTARAHQPRGRA